MAFMEGLCYSLSNLYLFNHYAAAIIGFGDVTLQVNEDAGVALLTVAVLGDVLGRNAHVVVRFFTAPGTASGEWYVIGSEKRGLIA